MKTLTVAALLLVAVVQPSLAGPTDARGEKEPVLRECLDKAGFSEEKSEAEYEKVRWVQPNHYFLGGKIWISSGSDPAKFGPCLKKVDAK